MALGGKFCVAFEHYLVFDAKDVRVRPHAANSFWEYTLRGRSPFLETLSHDIGQLDAPKAWKGDGRRSLSIRCVGARGELRAQVPLNATLDGTIADGLPLGQHEAVPLAVHVHVALRWLERRSYKVASL